MPSTHIRAGLYSRLVTIGAQSVSMLYCVTAKYTHQNWLVLQAGVYWSLVCQHAIMCQSQVHTSELACTPDWCLLELSLLACYNVSLPSTHIRAGLYSRLVSSLSACQVFLVETHLDVLVELCGILLVLLLPHSRLPSEHVNVRTCPATINQYVHNLTKLTLGCKLDAQHFKSGLCVITFYISRLWTVHVMYKTDKK